jgi:molybdate transport system substrate-binding protein
MISKIKQTGACNMKSKALLILSILLIIATNFAKADSKITVFAAASLTNAMTEIATAYEKDNSVLIQTSFAASSTLAKQIENGAPADIYISADTKWMNYLQDKNLINAESRLNLLGNHLVLIAPKGKSFKVETDKTFNFASAFNGRLCTGETESVPVGIYAKQSLKNLNWWDSIKTRIVGTQDVRAALVFVERGECEAGIVYETDAKVSEKVESIATLPDGSHDPIVYPLALIKNASAQATGFYEYLKSEKAKSIFTKFGFSTLAP